MGTDTWTLETDRLPTVERLLRAGADRRLHMGAHLYVSMNGEVIADEARGLARPDRALTRSALAPLACNVKPLTTIVLAQLVEAGRVDLDAPVAEIVPEFGCHGKEATTARHLLTNTSGIITEPPVMTFMRPWDDSVAASCALEPARPAGHGFHYLSFATWFVLAEMVRRTVGVADFSAYIDAQIFEPLGMENTWLSTSAARFRAHHDDIIPLQGMTPRGAVLFPHPWNDPGFAPVCIPGDGGRGPMHEFARVYESLLGTGGRVPLISEATARAFTAPILVGRKPATSWALGFMADEYGFRVGQWLRPGGAFGHDGSDMGSFGDWRHGLAVAFNFVGHPRESTGRLHRKQMFMTALYRDLELTTDEERAAKGFAFAEQRLDRFLASAERRRTRRATPPVSA